VAVHQQLAPYRTDPGLHHHDKHRFADRIRRNKQPSCPYISTVNELCCIWTQYRIGVAFGLRHPPAPGTVSAQTTHILFYKRDNILDLFRRSSF
jgi:hypothetical protein